MSTNPSNEPPSFRCIYSSSDEPEYWKEAVQSFPNKVPRFSNKEDAVRFIEKYCNIGSNPIETALRHSVSTLTDWGQIEKYLLTKMTEYDRKWDAKLPSDDMVKENRYMHQEESIDGKEGLTETEAEGKTDGAKVYENLKSRLNLSVHSVMTKTSTLNTLKYLFYHMRCGIFVMIRNNELVMFVPFVNKDYENTWGDSMKLDCNDGTIGTYYDAKGQYYRKENILPEMSKWWANGNIICNEHDRSGSAEDTQWWGDHFLFQLKDMLSETCRLREMPDCEFFINKRDYPHLKFHVDKPSSADGVGNSVEGQPVTPGHAVEPYGFIFDRDDRDPAQDIPLSRERYKSYAPILSFYTSSRFADIPFPPSEDWEAATGEVFPSSFFLSKDEGGKLVPDTPRDLFTAANLEKFDCPWENKVPTAFFRGTATGGGVTAQTNQRLHVSQLSFEWSYDPAVNGKGTGDAEYPYLDAMITGWNLRDKKIAGKKMNFLRKDDFRFEGGRKNFKPIFEQSTYKYLVYAEGHCAACRYGFMMQLGSVILKVESKCVADEMWYFPLLKPYRDHVPVKSDLSDLKEKIAWCRANDDKCREIAQNARNLYKKFVSRDGILDYMQAVCFEIAKRWRRPPSWAQDPPQERNPPALKSWNPEMYKCTHLNGQSVFCGLCEKLLALEKEAAAAKLAEEGAANDGAVVGEKRGRPAPVSEEERERKEALKKKKEEHIAAGKEARLQQKIEHTRLVYQKEKTSSD